MYDLNVSGFYFEGITCDNCTSEYLAKEFTRRILASHAQRSTFCDSVNGPINANGNRPCGSSMSTFLYIKSYCRSANNTICDNSLRCCQQTLSLNLNDGTVTFSPETDPYALLRLPLNISCPPNCNPTCYDLFRGRYSDYSCMNMGCESGTWLKGQIMNVPIPGEPGCYLEVTYDTRFNEACTPTYTDISITKTIRKGNCSTLVPTNDINYFALAYQFVIGSVLSTNPAWMDLSNGDCFNEVRTSNGQCWTWSSMPPNSDTLLHCLNTGCCWQKLEICKVNGKPSRPRVIEKSINQVDCVNHSYPCVTLCYDIENPNIQWLPWPKKTNDTEESKLLYNEVLPGIYQVNIFDINGKVIFTKQIILDDAYNQLYIDYSFIKERVFIISITKENKLIETKKIVRE